jgi:hypothetical protein
MVALHFLDLTYEVDGPPGRIKIGHARKDAAMGIKREFVDPEVGSLFIEAAIEQNCTED